jgi:hypothetical protein
MSRQSRNGGAAEIRELRAEYRFDYGKARPNPYAARLGKDTVTVVLDPDVAEVFTSSECVNGLLRSVIAALPKPTKGRTKKRAG